MLERIRNRNYAEQKMIYMVKEILKSGGRNKTMEKSKGKMQKISKEKTAIKTKHFKILKYPRDIIYNVSY